jgi:quinol monooxygenase YgiN
MIYMTVTFTIVPDHEQAVIKLLRKLVHHAQTDPNILQVQVYHSRKEPYHFFACLQFADQGAAVAHEGSAYYGEYVMTNLYGMLESDSLAIEIYEPVFEDAQ